MTAPLLSVSGLGKSFRHYRRESDRILGWFGVSMPAPTDHWVLRDISFSVAPGEAVGIVGRNGAGKSTLLKMVAGIMRPSEGSIGVRGRVSAILELGMGFNQEFTGRRNVEHAAGMMGFTAGEIASAMENIRTFAEIGDYFDQPIRVYSSGMQMRLAFAVATAFRPDILIVDEALSVGDAYFQHKSMERIRRFQKEGTALILVSHDKVALQTLCTRAVLLNEGRLVLDGSPEAVLDYYNALLARKDGEEIEVHALPGGRVQTVSGSRHAAVEEVILLGPNGTPADTVTVCAQATLVVKVSAKRDLPCLILGYSIKDRLGTTLFGINTAYTKQPLEGVKTGDRFEFRIAFPVMLGPGTYSIALALTGGETHIDTNYEWRDLALIFTVVNIDQPSFDGRSYIPPVITIQQT